MTIDPKMMRLGQMAIAMESLAREINREAIDVFHMEAPMHRFRAPAERLNQSALELAKMVYEMRDFSREKMDYGIVIRPNYEPPTRPSPGPKPGGGGDVVVYDPLSAEPNEEALPIEKCDVCFRMRFKKIVVGLG